MIVKHIGLNGSIVLTEFKKPGMVIFFIVTINKLSLIVKRQPTHIQAHLVFTDTQAKVKNQKSLNFANAQRDDRIKNVNCDLKKK